MADNAVVTDGVAGFRRISRIPWLSHHAAVSAFCEMPQHLSEKRRDLA
jgi:hypothetical protein